MISLPVLSRNGEQVGSYEFDPAEIADRVSKQLLHDVVVMYESNQRAGTVATKSRGEVAGSTKKLFRQKGTGRARMGPKRTPMRRGGGHALGKKPVDHSYRLPRRAVVLATRMALLSKFQDGQVTLVDRLEFAAPKTKELATVLKAIGVSDKSCLIGTDALNANLYKSGRNIQGVVVREAREFNAYDLLRRRQLVLTTSALDQIRGKNAGN